MKKIILKDAIIDKLISLKAEGKTRTKISNARGYFKASRGNGFVSMISNVYLGYYETEQEAAGAYNLAYNFLYAGLSEKKLRKGFSVKTKKATVATANPKIHAEFVGKDFGKIHVDTYAGSYMYVKNGLSYRYNCTCKICGKKVIRTTCDLRGDRPEKLTCGGIPCMASYVGADKPDIEELKQKIAAFQNNGEANIRDVYRFLMCFNGTNTTIISTDKAHSATGVKGVQKNPWGYVANIGWHMQHIHLGSFKTIEEAAKVRKEAEEYFYKPTLDLFWHWIYKPIED